MPITYPHYVKTPTHCVIEHLSGEMISRKIITGQLENQYHKKMLFILMNPSKVNEHDSDNTLNKCASVAFTSIPHLEIGEISIVNVYPFYESSASHLNSVLHDVKSKSKEFYYKEMFANLRTVQEAVKSADYILLGTGGIPGSIIDKEEYTFILDTIVSYVESFHGTVFLGTSTKYHDKYVYMDKYSYHICPNGNPNTIDKIKLHKVQNGKFISIQEDDYSIKAPLLI